MSPAAGVHGARGRAACVAALVLFAAVARGEGLEASPRAVTVSATKGAQVALELEAPAGTAGLTYLAETCWGSLSPVDEVAPGRHRCVLSLPPADMPRTVLVVFTPQGRPDLDAAWRLVPVSVSTKLEARTEPRSQVTARVGDRSFGPVTARRDGSFDLDVVIPPGAGRIDVTLEDPAGNATKATVAVPSRPHDPLTVTLDRYRLASDGQSRARVIAFLFGRAGAPITGATIEATASVGTLSAFEDRGNGVHVATYQAPDDGTEGVATLRFEADMEGRPAEIEQLRIVRGLPGSLALAAAPTELVAGQEQPVSLVATVKDAAGHPLAGQPVRLSADRGELTSLVDRGDGTYAAELAVPAMVESGSLEVKALLALGAPEHPPARLDVKADPKVLPTSWRAFSAITATVRDARGEPVPGEVVLFHVARGEGRVTPVAVTNASGEALADFSADETAEIVAVEATSTSSPGLVAAATIEKRASGTFATVSRPALAAQGGRPAGLMVLGEEHRVLQDSVLLTITAGAPSRLVASADPSTLVADGRQASVIRAVLLDENGNPIDGEDLAFAAGRGSLGEDRDDGDGARLADYTAPDGAGSGQDVVTVTHATSGLSATVAIALEIGPASRIDVAAVPSRMPADGASRSVVTATVSDATGLPVRGEAVTFTLDGPGEIGAHATTGPDGRASVELLAGDEPGTADITVEAASGAQGTTTVELTSVGVVALSLEAEPETIPADGRTRAELTARLEDAFGNPVSGQPVRFDVRSGPGRLLGRQATSDSLGMARQWIVAADAGLVVVRAAPAGQPAVNDEVGVEALAANPRAAFTASDPACTGGTRLTAVATDAAAWDWDTTGDGVTDATGPEVTVPLPSGRALVTLTVTEADGSTASAAREIEVAASPRAALAGPARGASGAAATLDASASSSAGEPVTFAWDLDGDGAHDDGTSAMATWQRPDGRHVARVQVTNRAGCSSVADLAVIFGDVADVAVTKRALAGPGPHVAGTGLDYEIEWRNAGTADAEDVVVTDDLPPLLSVQDVPAGAVLAAPGRLEFRLGRVARGARGTLRYSATISDVLPEPVVTLTNVARIASASPDADASNDVSSVSVAAAVAVDLALSAVADAPSARPAETVRVTFSAANLSAWPAEQASLEVRWNDALAGTPAGPAGLQAGPGVAILPLGTLAPMSATSVALDFPVAAVLPSPSNELVVAGRVAHAGLDPEPANDEASSVVALEACPDLSVALEARPRATPLLPGTAVAFRIDVENRGSTDATDARVVVSLDDSMDETLLSNPDAGVVSPGEVEFLLGRLAAGASRTLTFEARVAAALPGGRGDVDVVATALAVEADCRPIDDEARVKLPVEALPDLVVSVTAPAAAAAGERLGIDVSVENRGSRASDATALTVVLSGAATTLAFPPASSRPVPGGFAADVPALAPGASLAFRHEAVLADPQASPNPSLAVDAALAVGGTRQDSDPSSDAARAIVAVRAVPDLSASLTLSPADAAPGDTVTATVVVASKGSAPAPSGTLVLDWSGQPLVGVPPVGLPFPAGLPVGSTATRSMDFRLQSSMPAATTLVTVAATVTSLAGDSMPSDDTSVASVTVHASVDLSVALSVPRQAGPGQAFDVVATCSNRGAAPATAVQVALSVDPAVLALQGPSALALGAVPPGGTASATFRVGVTASLPAVSQVTSLLAAVTCAEPEGRPGDESAAADVLLTSAPDASIALDAQPSRVPPSAGDTIRYVATVTNGGTTAGTPTLVLNRDPSVLAAVVDLPPGAADDGVSGRTTLALPSLAPGASAVAAFEFALAAALPDVATTVRVDAEVTTPLDADPANDRASSSLLAGAVVDLVLDGATIDAAGPVLSPGESARLTVRGHNGGTTTAPSPILEVTYPSSLATVTAVSGGGVDDGAGTVTWSALPSLAAGASMAPVEIALRVADALPATSVVLAGEARLSCAAPEATTANNARPWAAPAAASASLCVTLDTVPSPSPAALGGTVRHVVTVRNVGTTDASPVVVALETDPLVVTGVLDAGGGSAAPGIVSWTDPVLPPGAVVVHAATFTLVDKLSSPTVMATATARADAPQDGACACPCSDADSLVLSSLPNLRITKTLVGAAPSPAGRGSVLSFRLDVENRGRADALATRVEDLLPPELSVVDAGGGTISGGLLTWDLGTLGALDVRTISYDAQLPPDLAAGIYRLENVATVSHDGDDADVGDNRSAHVLDLRLDVDLVTEISCRALDPPARPGGLLEVVATVRNIGSGPATGGAVRLSPPSFARIASSPPSAGPDPAEAALGILAPGASSGPLAWTVVTDAVLPAASNAATMTATATCGELDADPASDAAACTLVVPAAPDLRATLSATGEAGAAPYAAGERIDFTALVSNAGTTAAPAAQLALAFDAALFDLLPGGDVAGAPAGGLAALGTLLPGDPARVLRFALRARSPLPAASNAAEPCVTASSALADAFTGDDTACLRFSLEARANLVTSVAVLTAAPGSPGTVVAYRATVSNAGTTTEAAVQLVHERDPVTTTGLVSSALPGSDDGRLVTFDLGPLGPGASTSVDYGIQLAPTMASLDVTTPAQACAEPRITDGDPADNCASVDFAIRALPDAFVTLAVDAPAAPAGGLVTATLSYGNVGLSPLASTVVDLAWPATLGLAPGGDAGTPLPGGGIRFTAPAVLGPGESVTKVVPLRVASTLPDTTNPGMLTAAVSHGASAVDRDPANDVATAAIAPTACADLAVRLVRAAPVPAPGGRLVLDATWVNEGTTTARSAQLVVTDSSLVDLVPGREPSMLGRTFPLGDLAPGATGTQRLEWQVKSRLPEASNPVTTVVSMSSATLDCDPADDAATSVETVEARPDLWTTLVVDAVPAPAAPGSTLTVTATCGNSGQTAATAVTLSLSFDASIVRVVDARGGALDPVGGTVTFAIGGLDVSATAVRSVVMEVLGILPAVSNDLVLVGETNGAEADLVPGNDTVVDVRSILAAPDLRATIRLVSSAPSPPHASGTATLEATVENGGTTRATGVRLVVGFDPLLASVDVGGEGGGAPGTGSLAFDLGTMPATPGTIATRTFRLRLASEYAAVSNSVVVTALASSLEADADNVDNADAETLTVGAAPDLVLTTVPPGGQPIHPPTLVSYTYTCRNVGSAPAENVWVRSAYDPTLLAFLLGGVSSGSQVDLSMGGNLLPGRSVTRASVFAALQVAPPPTRRLISRTAAAEELAFGVSRDLNPPDNVSTSDLDACYLQARTGSTLAPGSPSTTVCLGSRVTVTCLATPATGVTYSWTAAGGTLTAPDSATTEYTPPAAGGTYRLTCAVFDPLTGCSVTATHDVFVDPQCAACGCGGAPAVVSYVNGSLERADQPGNRTVTAGEWVAFRLQFQEGNNRRSSTLLGGQTVLELRRGNEVYRSELPGDIYVECNSRHTATFATAQVPPGMPVGSYIAQFTWALDDSVAGAPCATLDLANESSNPDRIEVVAPTGLAVDPSVDIEDWGPRSVSPAGP